MAGSCLLAFAVTYLAGAEGYAFVLYAAVLSFFFLGVAGALRGFILTGTLERDLQHEDDGKILHITGPGGSRNDE